MPTRELSNAAGFALALAGREAEQLGSTHLDVEHLFLGLCKLELYKDEELPDEPDKRAVALEMLEEITALCRGMEQGGLDPTRARRRLRRALADQQPESGVFSGHRTPRCRRIFADAASYARPSIDTLALAAAALRSSAPMLAELCAELSVDPGSLADALVPAGPPGTTGLDEFGRDLTRLAAEGRLTPAVCRDRELLQLARILARARKNNPLVIGDPGVGKTKLIEGLALRLQADDAPAPLKGLRIFEVIPAQLVAGAVHRGELEGRVQQLVEALERDPKLVLFIDEIHTIASGSGRSAESELAGVLKPALARGSMRVIGTTTFQDYRSKIERDQSFVRRFEPIWLEEPSREDSVTILESLRPALEAHHKVQIPPALLPRVVYLASRYLSDRKLPDKAIDLLDAACTLSVFGSSWTAAGSGAADGSPREITARDVERVVSSISRVPVSRLEADESARLLTMEEQLRARVMGQDHALTATADAIRAARTGLKNPNRPVVFLFLGPTGTGKTELAKALADFLFGDEKKLIRLDLSEYSERHTVSKLIGSPPGYVDHEEGGQLTSRVEQEPYSVVLFDELEKAHPEVMNVFLQILDEGWLTDGRGRRVSFRDTVVVFTSNVGSDTWFREASARVGFGVGDAKPTGPAPADGSGYEGHFRTALNRALPAELVNRFQEVVVFRPLSRAVVRQIIGKSLAPLNVSLAEKGVTLALDDSALDLLEAAGFDERFGAREMERAIQRLVVAPLARRLLAHGSAKSLTLRAVRKGESLEFEAAR